MTTVTTGDWLMGVQEKRRQDTLLLEEALTHLMPSLKFSTLDDIISTCALFNLSWRVSYYHANMDSSTDHSGYNVSCTHNQQNARLEYWGKDHDLKFASLVALARTMGIKVDHGTVVK